MTPRAPDTSPNGEARGPKLMLVYGISSERAFGILTRTSIPTHRVGHRTDRRSDLAESGMPPSGVVLRDPAEDDGAASPALFQRFRPFSVSRFNVAFSDSAAALSADVPTAPRDGVTPIAAEVGELGRCILGAIVGVEN